MKQFSVRLDDDQYEKLKKIAKRDRINNIGWLVRRSVDMFIFRYENTEKEVNLWLTQTPTKEKTQ